MINQKQTKMTAKDIENSFRSKFNNSDSTNCHIPEGVCNQVIFSNPDFKKLRNYAKRPVKNGNFADELMKPVKMWNSKENKKIQDLFKSSNSQIPKNKTINFQLTFEKGKFYYKDDADDFHVSTSKNSSSSSSKADKLLDKDIRALKTLKSMFLHGDIQWGKIFFKNDPEIWDDLCKNEAKSILEDKELIKNFSAFYDVKI